MDKSNKEYDGYIDFNLYYNGEDKSNDGIITNPIHLFIQEIELALKIGPGEIWGCKYSIELSKYLFNQFVTTTQIQREVTNFISVNCEHASVFNYEITTEILQVENKDLIYIVANIYDNDTNQTFLQKYLLGI